MKLAIKISMIIAAGLISAAILIFVLLMSFNNWDFKKIGAVYTEKELEISAEFDSIEINVETADIVFQKSENGKCKVVTYTNEKLTPTVSINDAKLVIENADARKWYEHITLFSFNSPKITVYLPQEEYGALDIDSSTGNTKISAGLKLTSLSVSSTTGDVECYAEITDTLKIDVTSGDVIISDASVGALSVALSTGDVTLSSLSVRDGMDIKTTTGKIKLNHINGANINIKGTSGDVILGDTVLIGKLNTELTTGEVRLDKFDAAEIYVKTTTGDIKGTLTSDKIFFADTATGDISVPKTVSGGTCTLLATTGDIEISIEN